MTTPEDYGAALRACHKAILEMLVQIRPCNMITPQPELYDLILRQIDREAEAEAESQFNITSKAAREKLAHNIYGNVEMAMRARDYVLQVKSEALLRGLILAQAILKTFADNPFTDHTVRAPLSEALKKIEEDLAEWRKP